MSERIEPHQQDFGYKAIWSHEFAFKTWVEDPAPMIEAVRGYLATDYDYPANIASVRDDLEAAKKEALDGVDDPELESALQRSLGMNPLTPDHHFYIDQGTNARLRLVLMAIGRKLAEAGTLGDPEDVMYLRYNELRLLMADQGAFDAQALVGDRRDEREDAFEKRPPSWVGSATQTALDFPYNALWGFPEKFHAGEPEATGELRGLAASAGVVEGEARYVRSLDEFDQVKDGEILVCRMTNPAWVVLFTKITGPGDRGRRRRLAPGRGGARVRHPGGGGRDRGGRADRDRRPRAGERQHRRRRDPRSRLTCPAGWPPPRSRRRSTLRAERGAGATVLAGGTFVGILMNQGFLAPEALLSLGRVRELDYVDLGDGGELRLGAMATHRDVERSPIVRAAWPALARTFSLVASPRVRNQATVGGVLADADYASDPPAMLAALGARVVLRSPRGERERIGGRAGAGLVRDLHRARRAAGGGARAARRRAVRCTASSARAPARTGPASPWPPPRAATDCAWWWARWPRRPQEFPDVCTLGSDAAEEVGRAYAERIEPMSDSRGSAAYRRRVIAVEVRRALEELR